ncbi:uncharacterized protein LOC126847743 isoform X2 [Adelges cooleyi]|uniref:uncharacterized protein LOC126847743 isoform X2 n=1 Tax=Adelges cooleyi TaxID=133065 RepID=UPI00217F7673|nr:uncharacterized protein LOC126847743 isoform X2 [Adelges cooleyi]
MIDLKIVLCFVFVIIFTILHSGEAISGTSSSDDTEATVIDDTICLSESESDNKSGKDKASSSNNANEEIEATVDGADSEDEPEIEDMRFIHQACKDLSGCLKEKGLYQLSTLFMLGVTIFPVTYELLGLDKTPEVLAAEKWKWIETLCPDRMTDDDIKLTKTRQNCRDLAKYCITEYVKDILYPGLKSRLPLEAKIDSFGNATDTISGKVIYKKAEFFPGNGHEHFKKEPILDPPTETVPVERL